MERIGKTAKLAQIYNDAIFPAHLSNLAQMKPYCYPDNLGSVLVAEVIDYFKQDSSPSNEEEMSATVIKSNKDARLQTQERDEAKKRNWRYFAKGILTAVLK